MTLRGDAPPPFSSYASSSRYFWMCTGVRSFARIRRSLAVQRCGMRPLESNRPLFEIPLLRNTDDCLHDLPTAPNHKCLRKQSNAAVCLRDGVVAFRDRVLGAFQFCEPRGHRFIAIVHRYADYFE